MVYGYAHFLGCFQLVNFFVNGTCFQLGGLNLSLFDQLFRFLLFVLSIGRVVCGVFLVVLRQNRLH